MLEPRRLSPNVTTVGDVVVFHGSLWRCVQVMPWGNGPRWVML